MAVPRTLLVGIDKSKESQHALDWTLELAAALGARVLAVHAVGLLEGAGLGEHPDLSAIVASAAERTGTGASVPVEVVEEPGPPPEVVMRVATRSEVELIVVGSRGLGGTLRQLGSTSEEVVSHATVPVVVLPMGRVER